MVELDRSLFRRLVQLMIGADVAGLALLVPEFVPGRRYDFALAADLLVERHYGPALDPPVPIVALLATVFAGLAGWLVASTFGLLGFRRWARFGVWASLAGLLFLHAVVFGARPSFATPLEDLAGMIGAALYGAVLLLAYAKGYGAEWFNHPADS